MRRIKLLLIGVILSSNLIKADEGMWLPILINQNMATMTEMGLELTSDDIYKINQSSIKDAIIALDRGSCTGELISAEGLFLTNHHCGYGEIQAHSSVDHDYLTDGFWAMSKDEELANPGKTVSFLMSAANVTDKILKHIPEGCSQNERNAIVDSISIQLVEEAVDGTHYEAVIESMFRGNHYYLFIYEVYSDVRLVGAPPESIGKYGSDTDNWMWPRHTGDFSLFRIYTDPDGKPAVYSEDNIPLKPKHFLPISIDGIQKDDFAFIMGYPGSTDRYLTSYGLKYTIDTYNPVWSMIRGVKQDIWKVDMDASDKVRIQYASKFARSANYWKYAIAQNEALKKLKVYDQKVALENKFLEWVDADASRKAKYGNPFTLIEEAYELNNEYTTAKLYIRETQIVGAELYYFAKVFETLESALKDTTDEKVLAELTESLNEEIDMFFKDYNAPTDKKTTKALLKLFIEKIDSKYYPSYINKTVLGKYKGKVDKYVDDIFKKSIFADQARLKEYLKNPTLKVLQNDLVYSATESIFEYYSDRIDEYREEGNLKMQEGMRLFVGGLLEMNTDKAYAPDANSTMRLTYGSVGDYKPADAVHYSHYTTLKGVIEKADPNVREFNCPQKLIDIYNSKDYGDYGNEDGTMTVCFTTNNDITGGNSGSPVINGKGQLIGLAFDGNYEAMSGDISFEKQMQKCINVDIRYVLLIIDKFAGAQNLIDELNIVKSEPQPEPVPEMVEEELQN